MSPKAHYPLEQTCLCSDNLIIHTGEPELSDSKSSLVAADQQESPTGGKLHRVGNRCGAELALIPSLGFPHVSPFPNHK